MTYYAGNYNHRSTQECAMEMQDTYARLDRSIANLLDILERKVGLQNVLLCIASTGYTDPDGADIGIYRIPGGEFPPEPLRHFAEHVSNGYLWRRTICGRIL